MEEAKETRKAIRETQSGKEIFEVLLEIYIDIQIYMSFFQIYMEGSSFFRR
jgi:hypothetical protein